MFGALVERTFMHTLGVYEPGVTEYIADVLTDFAHFRQVYKIKDLEGRPLEEVADMLVQADARLRGYPLEHGADAPLGGFPLEHGADAPLRANSFNREREVHKHIGDFTMFWAGIYPESLPALRTRWSKDQLIDYVRQGKSSYAIAASFDYGDYRAQAPVLKKLSDEFELCLYGLSHVRGELNKMSRA
jgi:hypothetical protein